MMEHGAESQPRYSTILHFIGRYKLLYGFLMGLILVSSILESFSVAAVFPLFSSLLGDTSGDAGGVLGWMDSLVDIVPISDEIIAAAVLFMAVFFAKVLLVLSRDILIGYAGAKVLYDVKNQVVESFAGADYQYHLDNKQGRLLYISLSSPASVNQILMGMSRLLSSLSKVVAITIILASILPWAALAFGVLGAAYYAGIHDLSKRVSFRLGEKSYTARTEQTIIINELFSGLHQILSFRAVKRWLDRFEGENKRDRTATWKIHAWQVMPRQVMEVLALGFLLGFISVFALVDSENFTESLATLGVFGVALMQLIPSLTSIGTSWMSMFAALPNAQLAYQTITGAVPARRVGGREIGPFEKSIVFENLSFGYPGRENLFKDINLEFQKGKVTAVVGTSGSGKSSIINLILGMFDPTDGAITIDGVLLQQIKQESWLSKIGFVSQEPFTFHSTVAENIRFGRDGHSMEAVIEAAKIANAHGFVSELPQEYETEVGERGMKLSGGQQQRIAIARAVLEGPEILIFDEATSSLDSVSEKLVQQAIDSVSVDRTVIIIAHRLSTVRNADKIIVLENGQIVEEGTHQELISRKGQYAVLADSLAPMAEDASNTVT
jgi:subfamily B ATP-binding cassette protein MsbA